MHKVNVCKVCCESVVYRKANSYDCFEDVKVIVSLCSRGAYVTLQIAEMLSKRENNPYVETEI